MSDYIERLRGELLAAEQRVPRRRNFGPAMAVAALVAVLVLGGIAAWPEGRDDADSVSTPARRAQTWNVGHLGDSIAPTMRRRLAAYGVKATVELHGNRMTISAPIDVTPLTVGGNLNVFDFEAARIGGPDPVSLATAHARNGLTMQVHRGYYALRDEELFGNTGIARVRVRGEGVVITLREWAQQRVASIPNSHHVAIAIGGRLVSIAGASTELSISRTDDPRVLAAVLNGGPIPVQIRPE